MSTILDIVIGTADEGNGDTPFDAFTKVKQNFTNLNNDKSENVHLHTSTDITDFNNSVINNVSVLANTTARHIHMNSNALDTITNSGAGNTVLTDSGSYISIQSLSFHKNYLVSAITNDDYSILDNDNIRTILCSTGAVDRTFTLPTATANINRIITFKKITDTVGNVIIDCEGIETIDGVTDKTISTFNDTLTVQCDGTNWYVI
jgi:hypothetical protein